MTAQLLRYVGAALALRRSWRSVWRRRLLAATRLVALCGAAGPLATYLLNLLPWPNATRLVTGTLVLVAGFDAAIAAAALAGPWRRSVLVAGAIVAALTALAFAAYATAVLLAAVGLAHPLPRGGRRRTAVVVVAGLGAAAEAVVAWPDRNSKFGGTIALVPGIAVTTLHRRTPGLARAPGPVLSWRGKPSSRPSRASNIDDRPAAVHTWTNAPPKSCLVPQCLPACMRRHCVRGRPAPSPRQ